MTRSSTAGSDTADLELTQGGPPPTRRRLRLPDAVTCAVILAMVTFVLGGLGIQLAGIRILADTSSLNVSSVYRDGGMPPTSSGTLGVNDTIDAATPNEVLFGDELRHGVFAAWNPYQLGGTPLAATPNYGLASPLALPFWVLPGWLAPAYAKLLELVVAIGGMYLFLRRLSLRPAAAWLGGLVFGSSAFLVAWTGWPQTRTAAMIPALFWTLDRLCERPRWRNVGLVALTVACLLFGGFPSVTGYALITGAAYVAVRLLAPRPWRWRAALNRAGAAAGAVLAGVALAAWQLLPWAVAMSHALVRGREQTSADHIPLSALATMVAPYALGSASALNPPTWFGPDILVESESYLGAAAVVLVVAAAALAGRGRALLPRGVWWFLVGGAAVWTAVIYGGGPLLALLQRTGYLFSDNFVGRARSVLGFLLAGLAAVGFELIQRRSAEPAVSSRAGRAYGIGVWLAAGLAGVGVYLLAHQLAVSRGTTTPRTTGVATAVRSMTDADSLNLRFGVGALLVVGVGAGLAWLWFGQPDRRLRTAALMLVPAVVAVPALAWVVFYYPHSRPQNFYPTNEVHTYLAATLGHERFFGTFTSLYGSVETLHGLRQFHGHAFMDRAYGELADALPGPQFLAPPHPATSIRGEMTAGPVAESPILDRAAVSRYLAPPEVMPIGTVRPDTGDGSTVTLAVGHPVVASVPVTGPVRGVGVTPLSRGISATLRAKLTVSLRDERGRLVAEASRVDRGIAAGTPFVIPLAADAVPAGTRLTATITLAPFALVGAPPAPAPTPIAVAARAGQPAITVVTRDPDDHLRLVFDDQTVIYERTAALPRARWASSTVVEPDPARRLALLSQGTLADDQVVLNAAGAPAQGRPATVTWVEDGLTELVLRVDAQGAGYLVVADAIQHGWAATVDGAPVAITPADHAFVGVAMPAGQHEVRLRYAPAGQPLAVATSLLVAAGLVIAVVAEAVVLRRRTPR